FMVYNASSPYRTGSQSPCFPIRLSTRLTRLWSSVNDGAQIPLIRSGPPFGGWKGKAFPRTPEPWARFPPGLRQAGLRIAAFFGPLSDLERHGIRDAESPRIAGAGVFQHA